MFLGVLLRRLGGIRKLRGKADVQSGFTLVELAVVVALMSIISLSTFRIINAMYNSTVASTQRSLQANETQLISEFSNYYIQNASCYAPALPPGNQCLTAGSDDLIYSGSAQNLTFYGLNEFCPGFTNTYAQFHLYLTHTGNYGATNVYDLMLTTTPTTSSCPTDTQDIGQNIVAFSFDYYGSNGNCVTNSNAMINDPPTYPSASLGPIDDVYQVSLSAVVQSTQSAQQVSYSTCIFLPNSQSSSV